MLADATRANGHVMQQHHRGALCALSLLWVFVGACDSGTAFVTNDYGAARRDSGAARDSSWPKSDAIPPDFGIPQPDNGAPPWPVCAEASGEAKLIGGQGVDIIWAIDSSASMVEEIGWLQANLNNFANYIGSAQVDYHVILIGASLIPIFPICVPPPLGGPNCTNGPRYLNILDQVGSTDGLERFVANYKHYQSFLRPQTVKHFVIVTDDDSAKPAQWFKDELAKKQNPGFANGFVFNSIVSFGSDPQKGCHTGADQGDVYLELTQQTGGAKFPICDTNWAPMFQALAKDIVALIPPPCSYQMPTPPDGKKIHPSQIRVTYTDVNGGQTQIPRVADKAACITGNTNGHGFYYDDVKAPTVVTFCDKTCQALAGGTIKIIFGCLKID